MTQTYFVECYWPGVSEPGFEQAIARAADLPREDGVTCLDSILIPADEIVLCVFEGPSAAAIRSVTDRAGLPCERIVECVRVAGRARVPHGRS